MKTLTTLLLMLSSTICLAQRPGETIEQHFFATLASAAANPGKTDTVGAPTGGAYTDSRLEGGVLVGFDVWRGTFADHLVIRGICPIFETATGRVRGSKHGRCHGNPTTFEAKPGFAVAGIEAQGGLRVDGFQVVFMSIHVTGADLDNAGTYKSEWVGGRGGGKENRLVPSEKLVIGIFGGSGAELDRIGLLFYDRE